MGLEIRHLTVGPFQENSYLLVCSATRKAIFVDPGDAPDELLQMADDARAQGVGIVNTHAHIDHVGAVAALQERLGIPFQVHAGERFWLDGLAMQAAMFGLAPPASPRVTRWHEDGEAIEVGDTRGRVIHTPGHTPGGCCLWFEQDQVLLTGDTLFAGSIGRTDFPGGSFPQLEKSIRERLFPLGDGVIFYPGHGPEGRLGEERRHNPFVGDGARGKARPRFI